MASRALMKRVVLGSVAGPWISLLLLSSAAGAVSGSGESPVDRIVSVLSQDATGRVTQCLGYTLSTDWIVTAKHCTSSSAARMTVLTGFGMTLPVLSLDAHPFLDLSLLRIEGGPRFALARLGNVVGGSHHVFGARNRAWPDLATSLQDPFEGIALVYETSPRWIRVQTISSRKPCLGDSGGPLIGPEGELDGTLSRGSVSCGGRDEYVIPDSRWFQDSMECRCCRSRRSPND